MPTSSVQLHRPKTGAATIIAGFLQTVALSLLPTISVAQVVDDLDETTARRVVILNATDPYLPAFLALDGAMREAILKGNDAPAELFAETLDMHRFPQALLDDDVLALLRKKYRNLKVDVIVADAPIALEFAQRHRAQIWPGAVIVFNSVPVPWLREHRIDPDTIGIPVRLEFEQTLDLALKLWPGTQQIAVIAGTADPDRRHLALARASLERYAGNIDVQYLVGLSLTETVAAVRALPSDSVVLYLTVFRDGAGAPQVPREVLKRIAAVSRAPIFGVFETYLGYGIAAGAITSFAQQGRRTGELATRLLKGEVPSAIGVQAPVTPGCIADWQQLRRWDIDESLLPADCEIRFRELTTWDRYHWQILLALIVILAQTALIAALMLNRRRLRKAQSALQNEHARRSEAEGLAARLRGRLARFSRKRSLGFIAASISHEINQPLIAIQNYAQAAKRRLESDVEDKPKLTDLVTKIEGQAERAGAITQRVRTLVSRSEPQLQPVSLGPLVEEVIRMMEPETENHSCRIAGEPTGDLPAVVADPLEVQVVLVNLLQNAMKSVCSSEQYDRRVSVDVRPINDREVQVSVTDGGSGVPPDRGADIFEPLYSSTSGGMGMGLAISREIIEAHGGRLWYEPNPAGGAVFRFTLRTAGS